MSEGNYYGAHIKKQTGTNREILLGLVAAIRTCAQRSSNGYRPADEFSTRTIDQCVAEVADLLDAVNEDSSVLENFHLMRCEIEYKSMVGELGTASGIKANCGAVCPYGRNSDSATSIGVPTCPEMGLDRGWNTFLAGPPVNFVPDNIIDPTYDRPGPMEISSTTAAIKTRPDAMKTRLVSRRTRCEREEESNEYIYKFHVIDLR